jgi:hypothetical protein
MSSRNSRQESSERNCSTSFTRFISMTSTPKKPSQLPSDKAIEKLFPKEVVRELRKALAEAENPPKRRKPTSKKKDKES